MSSVPTFAPNHVCKWYLAIFSFADQHRRKQATTAKRNSVPLWDTIITSKYLQSVFNVWNVRIKIPQKEILSKYIEMKIILCMKLYNLYTCIIDLYLSIFLHILQNILIQANTQYYSNVFFGLWVYLGKHCMLSAF